MCCDNLYHHSCRTHRTRLGSSQPDGPRTRDHTAFLIDVFDPGTLRTDYGIVADVVVSSLLHLLFMLALILYSVQPFTASFPRANINELISGDLLHQVIKGAFKDHLVDWIGEYLKITHGEARAKEYLDEIDRRYVCFIFIRLCMPRDSIAS